MPGGHGAQLEEPGLLENCPTSQGAQTPEPAGENFPAAQAVHAVSPGCEKLPAAQVRQAVLSPFG